MLLSYAGPDPWGDLRGPFADSGFSLGFLYSSTWITIPSVCQNQFFAPDVRLCFSVTNTSEQLITLDGTICSAISKLEVYCGSFLLVSLQEYGALFSMLYETQAPSTHVSGLVRHPAGLGRSERWRHCDATEKLKEIGARPAVSNAGRLTGAAAANHKKMG